MTGKLGKKPSFEELKDFLSIDADALDECLMEQAKLYEQAAESAADADAARDLAELELDELTAATDSDVRQTMEVAKVKATEAQVKAEISQDRSVMDKRRRVLELTAVAAHWKVLERSFSQRSSLLQKLVDLHMRTTYGYSLERSAGLSRDGLVAAQAEVAAEKIRSVRRKRLEDSE